MMKLGDFGVVRTGGWAGALIRYGTQSPVNHAFVYIGDGRIVEAEPGGAVISSTDKYDKVIWSSLPLTDTQRYLIVANAKKMVGVPYSWIDIAALALRTRGVKSSLVNHRIEKMNRLICSQLVDRAYELAGVHLFNDGRLPGEVTPGDLLDIIYNDPVPKWR